MDYFPPVRAHHHQGKKVRHDARSVDGDADVASIIVFVPNDVYEGRREKERARSE